MNFEGSLDQSLSGIPSPEREELAIEELLQHEPQAPEAWRRQQEGAAAAGEALNDFDNNLNAATKRITNSTTLSAEHKDGLLEKITGALQKIRLERFQQAGAILGNTANALLKAPDQFVRQCLAPVIASGGEQLKELTRISTQAAQPLLSLVEAIILRGANATGDALNSTLGGAGKGVGKFVQYLGEGLGPAIRSILKGVGEGAGEGTGAFVRETAQGVGAGAGAMLGAAPAGMFVGFKKTLALA